MRFSEENFRQTLDLKTKGLMVLWNFFERVFHRHKWEYYMKSRYIDRYLRKCSCGKEQEYFCVTLEPKTECGWVDVEKR